MSWETLFDADLSSRLCLTLFHSVWQLALLAAAVWAVDRTWGRRSVERSYALYVAALLVGLAAMPITYAAVDVAASPTTTSNRSAVGAVAPASPRAGIAFNGPSPPAAEVRQMAGAGGYPSDDDTVASRPFAAHGKELTTVWLPLASWIVALYAIGVCVMLARLIACMWRARRLGIGAELIAEGALVHRLNALARRWSMRVAPALARAEEIALPKVVGLARPTILLPASAITGLSPDELEMILAHELAHVRRYDTWVNLVQRLAEVALFFNPALWYLSRRISTLREYCCDELACRATSEAGAEPRVRYASALLRVVELEWRGRADDDADSALAGSDLVALAAAGRSPSELRRRVARLLGEPLSEPLRISPRGMLAIAGFVLLLFLAPPLWPAGELTANDVAVLENEDKPKGEKPPGEKPADNPTPDPDDEPVDLAIVVARHVLLLNGKEIITWAELEEKIASLPDPTTASPSFYITRGAHEAGMYDVAKAEMWRLHRDYKLGGHSEGSLWPRSDVWYDRIERPSDLVPDETLRVDGRVILMTGEPVAGAEVILITPVDPSISYKSYHVALVRGRVRNRLDHVMTETDQEGRFSLYPPRNVEHYILALHPEAGFALKRSGSFPGNGDVKLLPWAGLVTELAEEPGAEQQASLSTRVAPSEGRPEVVLNQHWSDLKNEEPTRVFTFTHVPPIYQAAVSRDFPDQAGTTFCLSGASVSLLPGETRSLGLGPLSEQQRRHLERLRQDARKRHQAVE